MKQFPLFVLLAFCQMALAQSEVLSDAACNSPAHRLIQPLEGHWLMQSLEGPDVSGEFSVTQSLNHCNWLFRMRRPGLHLNVHLSYHKAKGRWLALRSDAMGQTELMEGGLAADSSLVFWGPWLSDGNGSLFAYRWRFVPQGSRWIWYEETVRIDGSLWMLQASWSLQPEIGLR